MKKDEVKNLSSYLKEILTGWPEMISKEIMATEKECEKLIERKYKETLKDICSKYEEFIEELKREETRKISSVKAKLRSTKMREVKHVIDQVMKIALKEISEMPRDEKYVNVLHNLIVEGLNYIPSSEVVIYVNERDKLIMPEVLKKFNYLDRKLTIGEKPIKTVGGVFLSSVDGSVIFDNTFETRLMKNDPRIRVEIYKILFKSG